MRDGRPSITASRVAAYRLGFERLPHPGGDPLADERLASDAAAGLVVDPDGDMAAYLEARTAFFDRVVLGGLERRVPQVVTIGAGYDGRAWRYAQDGSGGSRSTTPPPRRTSGPAWPGWGSTPDTSALWASTWPGPAWPTL